MTPLDIGSIAGGLVIAVMGAITGAFYSAKFTAEREARLRSDEERAGTLARFGERIGKLESKVAGQEALLRLIEPRLRSD